jgi:hypothetical protein
MNVMIASATVRLADELTSHASGFDEQLCPTKKKMVCSVALHEQHDGARITRPTSKFSDRRRREIQGYG